MRISSLLTFAALSSSALAGSSPEKRDSSEVISSIIATPEFKSIVETVSSSNIDFSSALAALKASPLYAQAWSYAASNPEVLSKALDYAKQAGLISKRDAEESLQKRDGSAVVDALVSDPRFKDIVSKLGDNIDFASLLAAAKTSPLYTQIAGYANSDPNFVPEALSYAKQLGIISS